MKVTFDVECTPDEARRFMGLPDVAPMQEALMKELEQKMSDNMRSLDPETMLKTWLPATMQGWGEVQKMFWNQMGSMGTSSMNAAQAAATRDAAEKKAKPAKDKSDKKS